MDDFLKDQVFLDQLDSLKLKEQFVRFTILDYHENPIKEIQGRVTSGSLNLNGMSSLRRTANLSLFAEEKENDLTQIDDDLSINRKIKLEIGFINNVPDYIYQVYDQITDITSLQTINYREKYGDIIWFKLGIFIIFDPNISHNTNGVSISVSLKDKMCLLNGDAGGVLPASTEFHTREQEDENGIVTIDNPTIRQIIQEVVQHWGGEDPARIIIEDVDERIKQVMRWMGEDPLYYYEDKQGASHYSLTCPSSYSQLVTINYGDEAGFILTDFIYPGELIGDAGSTVTNILDKIISVLGNFEYFYDVNGNFHFQEIKNYLNITYTTQAFKDDSVDKINYDVDFVGGKAAYTFAGSKLISSFANTPKYSNVKNDFMVWGVRKSIDGSEIPIRYHLAIDKIPEVGQTHTVTWYEDDFGVKRAKVWLTNPPSTGTTKFISKDYREELYMQGVAASSTGSDYSYYFTELVWELPKYWDFDNHTYKEEYLNNPSKIDFFLDIIDIGSEVGKYGVPNIGRRGKVVSDDKINCVFEQTVPDVIMLNINDTSAEMEALRQECISLGQDYVQVSEAIYSMLSIGGIQNSCYQRMCELLYEFTNMNNSITIQALPIYYLEPNIRINVQDPASGIYGDYMIQTISLPLSIDGMMNITANKALQKI